MLRLMGLLLVRVLVAPATELATNAVVQATTSVGMEFSDQLLVDHPAWLL